MQQFDHNALLIDNNILMGEIEKHLLLAPEENIQDKEFYLNVYSSNH